MIERAVVASEAANSAIASFSAGGGIGKAIVRKPLTFTNTSSDAALFTVTGAVIARLVAVCTTNVASAAGCTIGVDAGSTAVIADTDCTTLAVGEIWHDNSPDSPVELTSVMKEYILSSTNLVLDVETAKQVDSGVIDFYCIYTPLSTNGAVAAA